MSTKTMSPPTPRNRGNASQQPVTTTRKDSSADAGSFWREFDSWTPRQRQLLYITLASGAALLVLLVLLLMSLTSQRATVASPTQTPLQLPVVQTSDVLNAVVAAGFAPLETQTFDASNPLYNSESAIQFQLSDSVTVGDFTLLSYSNAAIAANNAFALSIDSSLTGWNIYQFSNVLLMASPATPTALRDSLLATIEQFIVAPFINSD